jgi:hypothetical protein
MLAPVIPENDEAYIDLFLRFDGRTSAHIGFRDGRRNGHLLERAFQQRGSVMVEFDVKGNW